MARTYSINSIFRTIQGEGRNAGRAAVFIRFAGCNMWNGMDEQRGEGIGACAEWCDTDFRPKMKLNVEALRSHGDIACGSGGESMALPLVVLTGGEPCLQVDDDLIAMLHGEGYEIAIETNGTVRPSFTTRVGTITISPKLRRGGTTPSLAEEFLAPEPAPVSLLSEHRELKVVLAPVQQPQLFPTWTPEQLDWLYSHLSPDVAYVQPLDPSVFATGNGKALWYEQSLKTCSDWVLANPHWRVGIQLHKILRIP